MFMKHSQMAATAFLTALIIFGGAAQVFASKGEPKVQAKDENCEDQSVLINTSNAQTARFASIPVGAKALTIVAENAKVNIKRDSTVSEIVIYSNCPRNWAVNQRNAFIRQAGFTEVRKGTALMADALGSRAIVNGRVYEFPPGPMKGLKLGADGVAINGQSIEPLKGSDIPCNCTGEDYLEIHVPQNYAGDLKIGSTGQSQIAVDSWKDGAVECTMLGNSSVTAGKLEALPKFAFDNKGRGSADIAELDAKIFVANISGQGNASIRVKKGKAEMSNATVEGNGTIELHGTFKKLQQLVNGSGKIEVKP